MCVECAIEKLGTEQVSAIQRQWRTLDTQRHGHLGYGNIGDGILVCLMKVGLSIMEIQSVIKVGGYQLTRLKKITSNSDSIILPRAHTLSVQPVNLFKTFFETLDGEDSIPCAHHRPKYYVLKEGKQITWKDLYGNYKRYAHEKLESIP